MQSKTAHSRWLIAPALFLAFCSRGNPTSPTSPSGAVGDPGVADRGIVGTSAAGDVKNGPIEISLVRVAQTAGVPAFFASAGGAYSVLPNREVEIYVQIWLSDTTLADAPRLVVDWGDGEKNNIHCGPCALTRTYRTDGNYTVTLTMDDRAGGTTKRTFTLVVSSLISFGTCIDTGHGVGCSWGACQNLVCAHDPYCCAVRWDSICVNEALGDRGSANFLPPGVSCSQTLNP